MKSAWILFSTNDYPVGICCGSEKDAKEQLRLLAVAEADNCDTEITEETFTYIHFKDGRYVKMIKAPICSGLEEFAKAYGCSYLLENENLKYTNVTWN